MAESRDLLVVGAGALGGRVAALWRAAHPDARVVAETRTDARHAALSALGVDTRMRDEPSPPPFAHVLLAIPASAPEYSRECERAACLWNGAGALVLTSSTAVYAQGNGELFPEEAPLSASSRAGRLLAAERVTLDAGGCVVRLAGLYDRERGPHRIYLRTPASPRRPDGLVNLLHYDDAAALCVAALERGEAGGIYLGCDNAPITRQDLASAACELERVLSGGDPAQACRFTGKAGPIGRRCDSTKTRQRLDWTPRHVSFVAWVESASTPRE